MPIYILLLWTTYEGDVWDRVLGIDAGVNVIGDI